MAFRFGLMVGLAAGYVLGTRDGRERYDQIVAAARAFAGSETAKTLEGSLKEAWGSAQQEWPRLKQVDDVVERFTEDHG
jgi:hypothetical protein